MEWYSLFLTLNRSQQIDFIPLTKEAFNYCIKLLKFSSLCKHSSLITQVLCDCLIVPKHRAYCSHHVQEKCCNSSCLRVSILFSEILEKIPTGNNRKNDCSSFLFWFYYLVIRWFYDFTEKIWATCKICIINPAN